jgi:hypothetical protein
MKPTFRVDVWASLHGELSMQVENGLTLLQALIAAMSGWWR